MDFRLYLIDKEKWERDGEEVGVWTGFPLNLEEIKSFLGLEVKSNELKIKDYQLPFTLDQDDYAVILKLEMFGGALARIENKPLSRELKAVANKFFEGNVRELLRKLYQVGHYEFTTLEEFAKWYLNEMCTMKGMDKSILEFVDYSTYGKHLEKLKKLLVTPN